MNHFNIQRQFDQMKIRGWDRLFWAIDLHDTVIEGKYNKFNEGAQIYPGAIEVLSLLTKRTDQKLILWTSSYNDSLKPILADLVEKGVWFDYINENPECPNTELCNFGTKFYFNILLDDKAGFNGATDWAKIKETLISINQWHTENKA